MSTEALASKFPSSPARPAKGTTMGTGNGTYLKGFGMFVLGLAVMAIPVIGIPIGLLIWARALWLMLKSFGMMTVGVEGEVVQGNCPHCETEIVMANKEETARTCPGCKHRLIYRKGQYLDVTA